MDTVTYLDLENKDGSITTFAIIAHNDGSFTSMTKATYDAMQANSTLPSNSSIPQAGE